MSGRIGRRSPRRWLRLQWGVVVVVAVATITGGHLTLVRWEMPAFGVRWSLSAGVVLLYELAVLRRYLYRNRHAETGHLRTSLGPATAITLARGLLLAIVAGFVFVPRPTGAAAWVPGLTYGSAVAFDFLDGVVARSRNQPTRLGAILDLKFDTVGLFVAPLLGVLHGQLPVWYLAVAVAKPVCVGALSIRAWRGRSVGPLPKSAINRWLAGAQMVVVALALLPIVEPPLGTVLATAAMIPFLLQFGRDWWAATTRPSRS
ncbi:CDP-alcohol phosphatidyltransferase family protein [Halobacteriales archaeon QS_8_65_32]|nr:MAG: CDP-alcohol phosphatidyltransferase family protein [Halobacteriales archaeon QS_8_65_32]